jgi:hypothetical protein
MSMRVTQAGAVVRLSGDRKAFVTQAGALVRVSLVQVRATQAGALVRCALLQVRVSQAGVLVRITPAPEAAERVLLITAALLYQAPVGEPLPDVSQIGYGEPWGGNWRHLGYTLEPLRFSLESDLVRVRVEQLLSAVRIFQRREELVLETTLAELSDENLQLALDGAITVGDGYAEIEAGGDFAMRDWAWGFEGYRLSDSGDKLAVRFFVHRGVAVLGGPVRMGKGVATGLPLRIEAVADLTRPAGKQLVESHIVMTKAM